MLEVRFGPSLGLLCEDDDLRPLLVSSVSASGLRTVTGVSVSELFPRRWPGLLVESSFLPNF